MTQATEKSSGEALNCIMAVPAGRDVREAIRGEARRRLEGWDRSRPLRRAELEDLGRQLLGRLGMPHDSLGFAMVCLDNEFWRGQFAAVPFARRLLLLPHCLRKESVCPGTYSPRGLACRGCGGCEIGGLKAEAERLGYEVLVAEGTPAVVQTILSGRCDAVLGVACLDSLEKAFRRVSDLGMPHLAVPLLRDGCKETEAETDVVREFLGLASPDAEGQTRGFVALLRAAARMFDRNSLRQLLAPCVDYAEVSAGAGLRSGTEAIALDWLAKGGKRFRPFLTLAAYAAGAHGVEALRPGSTVAERLPLSARRVALAIEALHKASLAHDDTEDGDLYRYGEDTLHRRHGVPTAINVGDYLVGLGYRLVAGERAALGGECVADMLACLSEAHVRLCRGQGAELLWSEDPTVDVRPIEVMGAYAQKTAPAFEAALFIGVRMAGAPLGRDRLRAYCRNLGVAYQVLNDLKDWDEDEQDKMVVGQDALSARPTILRAFALESGDAASRAELAAAVCRENPESAALARVREVYRKTGAFGKAEQLAAKCRERAAREASAVESEALRELMLFVLDAML